jgi:hypothetical protein
MLRGWFYVAFISSIILGASCRAYRGLYCWCVLIKRKKPGNSFIVHSSRLGSWSVKMDCREK